MKVIRVREKVYKIKNPSSICKSQILYIDEEYYANMKVIRVREKVHKIKNPSSICKSQIEDILIKKIMQA